MDLHARVAARIRELAAQRGIPLSHVPDRAGISRSGFWSFMGGDTSPSLRTLEAVAEVLEVSVAELVRTETETPLTP